MIIVPMTHGAAHQINIDLLLQSYYSLVENQKAGYVSTSFWDYRVYFEIIHFINPIHDQNNIW